MPIFGVFGNHELAMCPLNNAEAREVFAAILEHLPTAEAKYGIRKAIGLFHNAVEHTFVWILDARSAHEIQEFLIAKGVGRFNACRVIPFLTLEEVVRKAKLLE